MPDPGDGFPKGYFEAIGDALALRDEARRLGLDMGGVDAVDDAFALSEYNGVGPDRMSPETRMRLSRAFRRFLPAVVVHDLDYGKSGRMVDRVLADERLRRNLRRIAMTHPWYRRAWELPLIDPVMKVVEDKGRPGWIGKAASSRRGLVKSAYGGGDDTGYISRVPEPYWDDDASKIPDHLRSRLAKIRAIVGKPLYGDVGPAADRIHLSRHRWHWNPETESEDQIPLDEYEKLVEAAIASNDERRLREAEDYWSMLVEASGVGASGGGAVKSAAYRAGFMSVMRKFAAGAKGTAAAATAMPVPGGYSVARPGSASGPRLSYAMVPETKSVPTTKLESGSTDIPATRARSAGAPGNGAPGGWRPRPPMV